MFDRVFSFQSTKVCQVTPVAKNCDTIIAHFSVLMRPKILQLSYHNQLYIWLAIDIQLKDMLHQNASLQFSCHAAVHLVDSTQCWFKLGLITVFHEYATWPTQQAGIKLISWNHGGLGFDKKLFLIKKNLIEFKLEDQ